MKPTIGRIVHYRLTENDAKTINDRRRGPYGSIGNAAAAGDVVPLVVTAVWPSEYIGAARLAEHPDDVVYDSAVGVNGQAFLDGNDSLWICSAPEGALNGCWCWPPRENVEQFLAELNSVGADRDFPVPVVVPAPTVPVVEETPKAPAPEPVAAPVVADPAVPSNP